jgi:NAD(P)-dependent dehydrogenase (short-subunit alcohol dehydrogenase family)
MELASAGCPLLLVARGADDLHAVREEVRGHHPGLPVEAVPADVTDPAALGSAVRLMTDRIGPPGGLVCVAGFARPGRFEAIPGEVVRRLMEVNYFGTVHAVRAVLPHLGAGSFVGLTASVLGWVGAYGAAPYAASKFALVGFAECLRQELRPRGVHVSVLCPPDTDTPGYAEENRTKPVETAELSRSGGLVSPELVARRYLRELGRGRFLINVTLATRLGYRIQRWAPGLVRAFMDRTVDRVQRRTSRGDEP